MKTKAQKEVELKEGEELLNGSKAVLFFDFSSVGTKDMRNLRQSLKDGGNPMLVIKKRLMALLLKRKGIELPEQWKTQVATVFVSDLESASASVYKFFKELEKEKKVETAKVKILGGYDVANNAFLPGEQVFAIGALPPREAILGQLLYMIAAPIRSFLYVLDQKSKQNA